MIVDHKKKFVFIHIPKTGGTSISNFLSSKGLPANPHSVEPNTVRTYAEYFRFCFVRNPWGRLFSSFNYARRMAADGFIKGDFVRILCRDNPDLQFETFVMEHLNRKVVKTSGHFRPQSRWIIQSGPQFIGRIENIETDMKYVAKAIGRRAYEVPHHNKSSKASYLDAYTPEMIEKVHGLYRKDIDYLGYTFDGK